MPRDLAARPDGFVARCGRAPPDAVFGVAVFASGGFGAGLEADGFAATTGRPAGAWGLAAFVVGAFTTDGLGALGTGCAIGGGGGGGIRRRFPASIQPSVRSVAHTR